MNRREIAAKKLALWRRSTNLHLLAAPNSSRLVAAGDSWFNYVLGTSLDILDYLIMDHGYKISKVAKGGYTLEDLVWGNAYKKRGTWPLKPRADQLIGKTEAKIKKYKPQAVLLSGGGNDMTDEDLVRFLDHRNTLPVGSRTGLAPLRKGFVDDLINVYMKKSFIEFHARVQQAAAHTKVLVHGYGYVFPTGNGYGPGNKINFAGPWLRPAFAMKGIGYTQGTEIMKYLIETFNEMLVKLQDEFMQAGVMTFQYVNLRPVLGPNVWANEMHPYARGFKAAAAAFAAKI